jgi:ribose 5-phosphate isomerase A
MVGGGGGTPVTAADQAKRRAAAMAVSRISSGMVVGLGSGSTSALAVDELGRRLAAGEIRDILGIPTSVATAEQAKRLGIPLGTLEDHPVIDLTIDGADEVDPQGNLVKGLGGALLREKIVATASRRLVIMVDPSKLVPRLGTRSPIPVEVVTFAAGAHVPAIRAMGAEPVLRRGPDGGPYRTDEGHLIYDCRFPDGLDDPALVHQAFKARVGVVETGLFLGMRPEVVVGRVEGAGDST